MDKCQELQTRATKSGRDTILAGREKEF